jgi:hydroxypyruvate reductase
MNPRDLLVGSFQAAVSAADPLQIVPRHLPAPPKGRTVVVGAGKAAGAMALAVESHWPEAAPLEGVVITRYGHALPTRRIRVVEAGHPVPDEQGEAAARETLSLARSLGPDDLLLVLVSGGGSSLLSLPVEGIAMADLKQVTRDLLASGAPIQDMNTVRKHLSSIQGGRLALATRAQVLALVISDVTGDDPTHIASGPCAPACALPCRSRRICAPAPRAASRRRRSRATPASRESRTASSRRRMEASRRRRHSCRRAA